MRSSRASNEASNFLGATILYSAAAWAAFAASGDQPYWFYPALRGLMVICALQALYLIKAFRGWWIAFLIGYASIAGLYAFGNFTKEQWFPINQATGFFMAAMALLSCFTSIMAFWFSRQTSSTPVADPFDCYPFREMTPAEARAIADRCIEILVESEENHYPSRGVPESNIPGGNFPAVVEAFAREYCRLTAGEDQELLQHFRAAIRIFAASGSDWLVKAAQLHIPTDDDNCDPAVVELASSEVNDRMLRWTAWGWSTFEARIDSLRATK